MKKILITIFVAICVLLPINTFAEKINLSDYKTLNLVDALKDEQSINPDFTYDDISGYSENDKQVPIYLFRGKGCSHCEDFLKYVANTLVKNYGQYFKIISFETWQDSNNSNLQKKVSAFLGDNASGVPYIIIGNQTFLGYGESYNSQIESAITSLYNSSNRYDVFEEMAKAKESGISNASAIIWNVIITTIGVLIVIAYTNYAKNEILVALNPKDTSSENKKESKKKRS